jgi:hypothetical protein
MIAAPNPEPRPDHFGLASGMSYRGSARRARKKSLAKSAVGGVDVRDVDTVR